MKDERVLDPSDRLEAAIRGWAAPGLDSSTRARVGERLEAAARKLRRRRRATVALGATAALGIVAAVALRVVPGSGEQPSLTQVVETGPGEYRLLELAARRAAAFVGENARVEVRPTGPPLQIHRGTVRLVVKTSRSEPPFVVGSLAAEVAVLGTEFDVIVQGNTTEVRVTRGEVELRNGHGRRRVWPRELARARAGESPRYVERLQGTVVDLPPTIEERPSLP